MGKRAQKAVPATSVPETKSQKRQRCQNDRRQLADKISMHLADTFPHLTQAQRSEHLVDGVTMESAVIQEHIDAGKSSPDGDVSGPVVGKLLAKSVDFTALKPANTEYVYLNGLVSLCYPNNIN